MPNIVLAQNVKAAADSCSMLHDSVITILSLRFTRQVQERTQGPSITGLPIQAPHGQNMHGRQQKSTGKQGVVAPGPPQRQESWSKPGPRPQDGKGEKRPGAGAKQTKGLAWR